MEAATMPTESGGLKHFKKDEIYLTEEDAAKLLKWLFGSDGFPRQLNDRDIEFAQALLLEMIDMSYAMGYVQAIFDAFFMKVPGDIEEMVRDFAKKAAKNWFDHATSQKDLSKAKIYADVKSTVVWKYRSVWGSRDENGNITY
jgi:hypothetical protein